MDRLISFLVLVPFIVYFSIPAFMLLSFYIKKSDLNVRFVKLWSIGFTLFSILATFALMVVTSQADLAFNSGKFLLTEPLVQLSLASQMFGLFLLNSVFKNSSDKNWLYNIIKTMICLGLLTYLIFSNQFLSVFLSLIVVLVLSPSMKMRSKQIVSGLIVGLLIVLNFLNLEFSKSFSEIRITQLSGDINMWLGFGLVIAALIFILLNTLFVTAKNEKLSSFDLSLWVLLSPVALILCFYRMIQLGFVSTDSLSYGFSQWLLVFYLLVFVTILYLKRYNIKSLILSVVAAHTMIAMLFSVSGADDFSLSFSAVHFYVVSSIIVLFALFMLNKLERLKGTSADVSDLQMLTKSKDGFGFLMSAVVLFASALPPGPLFLVFFTGERSLIENGLYWSSLWVLIGLIFLGYFLFSNFVKNSDKNENNSNTSLELWETSDSIISLDFREFIYLLAGFIATYAVAFLNL